jgi:hypothetical protein
MDGLFSIYGNCVDPNLFRVNAVLDMDDLSLGTYRREIAEYWGTNPEIKVTMDIGYSKSKVDAFNRVPADWDILVAFSDDMAMCVKGWDRLIMDYMPEDLDWFIHFVERDSAERVSVMSVIGRAYYQRDHYVYHPSYKSLFCDNEATEVARLRERYLFIPTPICIHMNPAYGHLPRDAMFDEQQEIGYSEDKLNYEKREANNFDL